MKFLVLLLLAGCTAANDEHFVDSGRTMYEVCLHGVSYYQNRFSGNAAPAYNTDGSIKTCGETK